MSSSTSSSSHSIFIPSFYIRIVDIRHRENAYDIEGVNKFHSIKEIKRKLKIQLQLDNVVKNYGNLDIALFHSKNPKGMNVALLDSLQLYEIGIDLDSVADDGQLEMAYGEKASATTAAAVVTSSSSSSTSSEGGGGEGENSDLAERAADGTSGTYFMGNKTEVFKPANEEPGQVNNPHNNLKGVKSLKNFVPGQGIIREYAAYLMDIDNLVKVPKTKLAYLENQKFVYRDTSIAYPKYGALQEFVPNNGHVEDYSWGLFSDFEVQKIALFDMRTLNCDRNDTNILVQLCREKAFELRKLPTSPSIYNLLIPFDHGFCFPGHLDLKLENWHWMSAPQVKKPVLPEFKSYMKGISLTDIKNVLTQKEVKISKESLFLVQVCHIVIVESFEQDLTFHDIAKVMAVHEDEYGEEEEAETNSDSAPKSQLAKLIIDVDKVVDEIMIKRSSNKALLELSSNKLDRVLGDNSPRFKQPQGLRAPQIKRTTLTTANLDSSCALNLNLNIATPIPLLGSPKSEEIKRARSRSFTGQSDLKDVSPTFNFANRVMMDDNKADGRKKGGGGGELVRVASIYNGSANTRAISKDSSSPSLSSVISNFSAQHSTSDGIPENKTTIRRNERSFSDLDNPENDLPLDIEAGISISGNKIFGDMSSDSDPSPTANSWDIKFNTLADNSSYENDVKSVYDDHLLRRATSILSPKSENGSKDDAHSNTSDVTSCSTTSDTSTSGDSEVLGPAIDSYSPPSGTGGFFGVGGWGGGAGGGVALMRSNSYSGLNSDTMYPELGGLLKGKGSLGGGGDKIFKQTSVDDTGNVSRSRKEKANDVKRGSRQYLELRLEYVTKFIRKMLRSYKQTKVIEEYVDAYYYEHRKDPSKEDVLAALKSAVDQDILAKYIVNKYM